MHISSPLYDLVNDKQMRKIGIVATKMSIKTKVHELYLRILGVQIDIIYPDQNQQNMIEDIITRYW